MKEPKKITYKSSEETVKNLKILKLKYKYSTYDEVIKDTTQFFIDNDFNPREAIKPLQKLILDTRNTFVSFQKTFESKKLMPTLFEMNKHLTSSNIMFAKYIEYSTNFNKNLVELLESGSVNNSKKEEENSSKKDNQADIKLESIRELLISFLNKKRSMMYEGENINYYNSLDYNKTMEKIKSILEIL